ncbi:MAG: sigma-70 family RNA polymerase sigma factor, partial [Planctomycetota bacterium]
MTNAIGVVAHCSLIHRMLTIEPNTRHSLLIRLSDHDDQDAWGEFLRTYEPVLYRMARRRETQDADAREIVQEVLLRVAQRIQKFDLSKDGSFRGWLNRTTRNVVIDRFRRLRLRENGVGTDTHHAMLLATPHPDSDAKYFSELATLERIG